MTTRILGLGLVALLALATNARAQDTRGMAMDHGMNHGMDHGMDHHGAAFSFGAPSRTAQRTIHITIKGLRFSPALVKVQAGEAVRFEVTNAGDAAHEFVLGDDAEQTAHRAEMAAMANSGQSMMHDDPNGVSVPPHGSATLIWRFAGPGLLQYDCNIPGHFEAGMRGTLVVLRR